MHEQRTIVFSAIVLALSIAIWHQIIHMRSLHMYCFTRTFILVIVLMLSFSCADNIDIQVFIL